MKITFSAKNRIGQADKMIFGHFLEHFHRQIYGGVYDPDSRFADEDGFRTDVLEALRRIRTPIIRWPGGCYVSAYDWHFGVGKERVPTYDKAWRVEESNAFGTDEFVKLCRKLDCEPYICTNAGTGTAEQMSNWVEYCNVRRMGIFAKERMANGYPEPHGVKFWSIGNENWGGHEMGAKDAEEWGRLGKQDRTVEVVDAVVTWDQDGYAVAAVNKDASQERTVDFALIGDQVKEMRIHIVNGPSTDSYNDVDRTEVGVTVSEWMPFTGSVTLQPHSVNVIELR